MSSHHLHSSLESKGAGAAATARASADDVNVSVESLFDLDDAVVDAMSKGQSANLKKSDEFVMNSRGQKIAVRTWPAVTPAATATTGGASQSQCHRGVVVFVHGYCAHSNRPMQPECARQFTAAGYGYMTVDLHGHGYSDGLRAMVEDPWDLADDLLACVLALSGASGGSGEWGCDGLASDDSRLLGRQSKINLQYNSYNSSGGGSGGKDNTSQNLYFIGHSMGGAVVTLAGLALTQLGMSMASNGGGNSSNSNGGGAAWASAYAQKHALSLAGIGKSFKGTILLSPLIEINAPSAARPLFSLITQCCPQATLPQFLASSDVDHQIWKSKTYIEYCAMDRWPQNGQGLSYGGPMRIRTLLSFMNLQRMLLEDLFPLVSYPFLILHDPEDKITKFSGAVKATQLAPSKSTQLIDVPGGLHDMLSNDVHGTMRTMLQWLDQH